MAKRRRVRRYARRAYGYARRKAKGFTLPLLPLIGLGAGISYPAQIAMRGDWKNASSTLLYNYTGFAANGSFNTAGLKVGLLPLLAGILGHKIVGGKLGVNRVLASAGVPFIRV